MAAGYRCEYAAILRHATLCAALEGARLHGDWPRRQRRAMRTLLAVANHIEAPVQVRFLPVSHSDDPREELWGEFLDEWLDCLAEGVPEDFGKGERLLRGVAM